MVPSSGRSAEAGSRTPPISSTGVIRGQSWVNRCVPSYCNLCSFVNDTSKIVALIRLGVFCHWAYPQHSVSVHFLVVLLSVRGIVHAELWDCLILLLTNATRCVMIALYVRALFQFRFHHSTLNRLRWLVNARLSESILHHSLGHNGGLSMLTAGIATTTAKQTVRMSGKYF